MPAGKPICSGVVGVLNLKWLWWFCAWQIWCMNHFLWDVAGPTGQGSVMFHCTVGDDGVLPGRWWAVPFWQGFARLRCVNQKSVHPTIMSSKAFELSWTLNALLAYVKWLPVYLSSFGCGPVGPMTSVMTVLICNSAGEEVMNPVNEVRLHIRVEDFGDRSLPASCVEGWAEIDGRCATTV